MICWRCPAAGCSSDRVLHWRQHQLCGGLRFTGSARATGGCCNGGRCFAALICMQPCSGASWWAAGLNGSLYREFQRPVCADNIAMACYLAVISFCPAENVSLRPASALSKDAGGLSHFTQPVLFSRLMHGMHGAHRIGGKGTEKRMCSH